MGFFDKIQDSISSATEQTKSKAQESQLKRERKGKLEALGEQVYGLYRNGQLAHQELSGLCQEIADVEGRIAALEQQAMAARPQPPAPGMAPPPPVPGAPGAAGAPPPPAAPAAPPAAPPPAAPVPQAVPVPQAGGEACPSCGTAVEPGGRFCPNCGADVSGGAPPSTGPHAGGGTPPPPPPPPGA